MLPRNFYVRNAFLVSTLTIVRLLVFFYSSNNLAVAEESVRSLQYIETSGSITKGPDYVAQVMILDGCIRRMSMKSRPKEGFAKDEPAAPDLHDFFEIYDAKIGKRVYVYPDKREFKLVKGIQQSFGSGKYRVNAVKPDPGVAFDEFLRRPIPVEKAKELPERIVDGKRAIGFLVEHPSLPDTRTTTYWIDPTTYLPIRIEDRYQPADPKDDGSEAIRRNIIFDAPIDRSLFSTDPPPGYPVLPDADY